MPCNGIKIPPPQTIVINAPDAIDVYLPNPSTAILKIPPHITDVHNPTRINAKIPTGTGAVIKVRVAQSTPGILTITSEGKNIPSNTNTRQMADTVAICVRLDTLLANIPPSKRPTNMSNQYTATIMPTIPALIPKPGVVASGAVVRYCIT